MVSNNIKFELNAVESERARDFMKKHNEVCENSIPTLGEHYYYKITPNGLGLEVSIGCCYCDVEENITDIDSW